MDRTQYTTLMEVLTQVPDYRKRKGRLHRWMTLLSLIAMALVSAQRTPQAIARWIHEHRDDLFAVLPATVSRLPSGATIRRTLARLDVAALEQAVAAFHPLSTPAPTPPPAPASLQGVALDGKAVRGWGGTGIRVIWSLWCSMATRPCSARSRSHASAMSGVRLGRCSKGATCTGKC